MQTQIPQDTQANCSHLPTGQPQQPTWSAVAMPPKVIIILGYVGKGKSALAYSLAEILVQTHGLRGVVVNLPAACRDLLPSSFSVQPLESIGACNNSVVIIDEGTTTLPAGNRMEDLIKGHSSLCRQRNQTIIFIFHSSRDAGSRILRGVGPILIKEPSRRQIQFGSKNTWMRCLLEQAKTQFDSIKKTGDDVRKYTYVDSEDPDYAGLMENPLPSFWSDGLSKAWSGIAFTAESPTFAPVPHLHALQTITEYESTIPMSQYPDGWTPQDVGVAQDMLDYLAQQGFLTAKSAGRYTSTSFGRTMGLKLQEASLF